MIVKKTLKRRAAAAAALLAVAGGLVLGESGTASADVAATMEIKNGLPVQVDVWDNFGDALFSVGAWGDRTETLSYGPAIGPLLGQLQIQVWRHGANPGQLVGSTSWNQLTAVKVWRTGIDKTGRPVLFPG